MIVVIVGLFVLTNNGIGQGVPILTIQQFL